MLSPKTQIYTTQVSSLISYLCSQPAPFLQISLFFYLQITCEDFLFFFFLKGTFGKPKNKKNEFSFLSLNKKKNYICQAQKHNYTLHKFVFYVCRTAPFLQIYPFSSHQITYCLEKNNKCFNKREIFCFLPCLLNSFLFSCCLSYLHHQAVYQFLRNLIRIVIILKKNKMFVFIYKVT